MIADIENVGLWTFWGLKGHMQESGKIISDRYPETMMRVYVVNAPSFFGTVWGWVKKWFDPVTTAKIAVVSKHELREILEECIAPENIPKSYGGLLDWEYGDAPDLDPDFMPLVGEDLLADGPLRGPVTWIIQDDGSLGRAVKTGTVAGRNRRGVTANGDPTIINLNGRVM